MEIKKSVEGSCRRNDKMRFALFEQGDEILGMGEIKKNYEIYIL